MLNTFLFISGQEIFVILLVVLLLFGANKIPDIARGLGKGMNEFKKAADEIKKEMNDHAGDLKKDFKEINDEIKNTKDNLKG
jgi:sec-independent protein translocase protein TatA